MYKPPLILTISIDTAAQEYFNGLRAEYFPRHCNWLEAHLTLFHHLPADMAFIEETIHHICLRPEMKLEVAAVKNIGNGVAFGIVSEELQKMHIQLQQSFRPYLISQDRNKLWPHITVQNKVTAFKAKQTAEKLQQDFKPSVITATGVRSWLYMGGPWEAKGEWHFST